MAFKKVFDLVLMISMFFINNPYVEATFFASATVEPTAGVDTFFASYYKGFPVFENLTNLQLYWGSEDIHDWDEVVNLLENCPKLQTLKIEKRSNSTTKEGLENPCHVPECVSSHLTTCKIEGYNAVKGDFRFATYIMQNARLLRVMAIFHTLYPNSMDSPQFFEDLSYCPRISPACKLDLSNCVVGDLSSKIVKLSI